MRSVQDIVLFLSILLLIGLVYISYYNVYQTDDYIFSYSTRKLGILRNIKDFYFNWGGRYFGYSVNTLNPVFYDKANILPKIYPIFLIFLLLTVFTLNFKLYFKYSFLKGFAKSILLFFFYTLVLVSLPEHFFWVTGSNIYFLPVILSGLLLYFIGKYNELQKNIWLYLSIAFVVILMGSNEIVALILLGTLFIWYYQKKSTGAKILLFAGAISILISFLAPGNFKRLVETADPFYIKWIKRVGVFGVNSIYIFIKTALILPLFIKIFEKELTWISEKINFKKALAVWLVSFLPLLFTGYILNTIGRQFENTIFFYLLSASVVWMYIFKNIKKYWWISIIIIFLPETEFFTEKYTNLNIDYNLNNIINELFYTNLKEYNHEIEMRIEILGNSKEDSIILNKIKNVPKILYFDEMASVREQKKYVNDQLQSYFNKKYIRVNK